ncbi:MAG: hypothetical protein ChlgKO_05360 [Chlamydiales bacterium]
MYRVLFVFFIGVTFCLVGAEIFDLEANGFEQYQDIYLNGEVIKKASKYERFEDERFAILDSILSRYKRPFTMLDVGASQGYFTFRSAEKYPESVFVMLEGANSHYPLVSKSLNSICQANTVSDNVIWLDRSISEKDFQRLAKCEHFDVVLAQNILHWFPKSWKNLYESFRKMSHVTILELPPNDQPKNSTQYRLRNQLHSTFSQEATLILEGVPRHTNPQCKTTYYIFVNENGSALLDVNSLVHPNYGDRDHQITFDFTKKKFIKRDRKTPFWEETLDWKPGINLITYLCLNGRYPNRANVVKALPINRHHFDWMPNNMIIQGDKIALIDIDDWKNEKGEKGQNFCTQETIKKLTKLILSGDEKAVRKFLWN